MSTTEPHRPPPRRAPDLFRAARRLTARWLARGVAPALLGLALAADPASATAMVAQAAESTGEGFGADTAPAVEPSANPEPARAVEPATSVPIHAARISNGLSADRDGTAAIANVVVRDALGRPVAGATVIGRWSGSVSGTARATTDAQGTARVLSPRTRNRPGSASFTLVDIVLPGHLHESARSAAAGGPISW